ncbi:hypothetical protein FGRMN_6843 [Fusarium graminum]|nr:hypothetical protein FGRMN_6843 [Fusarium graminum]
MALSTTISYLARSDILLKEKAFDTDYPVSHLPGIRQTNHVTEDVEVEVHEITDKTHWDIDVHGFCILNHEPLLDPAELWIRKEEAQKLYEKEIEQLVAERFPEYTRIQPYDVTLRNRAPDFPIPERVYVETHKQPATKPHADVTPLGAIMELSHVFPGQEQFFKGTDYDIINVWRPLHGPNNDWPLAICDWTTIDPERDIVISDSIGRDRLDEHSLLHHNPVHKWYYIKDQAPSDLFVFRNTDSLDKRPLASHNHLGRTMAVSPEAAAIIQRKKAQYCRYADSQQWHRFNEIMLPDATYVFNDRDGNVLQKGDIQFSWSSMKDWAAFFQNENKDIQAIHMVGPAEMEEISPDEIKSIWSVIYYLGTKDAQGVPFRRETMRLIEARQLVKRQRISFVEFYSDIPKYAILSHTWDSNQEVVFQDCNLKSSKSKTGYEKIRKTCELALDEGHDYVWVDTCCIDKSSSAELTEAINSMFLWYQNATVCYVYLSDKVEGSPLEDCRWFTRGWTLQELIAPNVITFFNSSWECIGSKHSLMRQLTIITPIDPDILCHHTPVSSACIAKRLSWAAGRKTTRVEDMAYCLLGLCDVHMPMLYGEGKLAFRRLQEEIIRTTYDLSLLAWTPPISSDAFSRQYCGFLAESVNYFASCSEMHSISNSLLDEGDISVTNKGLKLMARVHALDYADRCYRYVLELDCMAPGFKGEFLTIPMRKVGPNTFVRARRLDEGNLPPFSLEASSLEDQAFYKVTLLTTMPSLTVGSPLSTAATLDLVSHSRFTLVSLELPPDISMAYRTETPVKFWDMEDHAFFGPRGSYRNWGAIVLETNTLFICFWHKAGAEWLFEATLLDLGIPKVQEFWRNLFLSSEQLNHQQQMVWYMLRNLEDEMKSSIETHLQDEKITLSFDVCESNVRGLCNGPRWTVTFERNYVENRAIEG